MQMHSPYTLPRQFASMTPSRSWNVLIDAQNKSNQLANACPALSRAPHRAYTSLADWMAMTPAQRYAAISAEEIELRNRLVFAQAEVAA